MGKRTRFQEKNVVQLVLQVKRARDDAGCAEPALADNADPVASDSVMGLKLPHDVALDDDTVLERLALVDEQHVETLSATEQAMLLGLM